MNTAVCMTNFPVPLRKNLGRKDYGTVTPQKWTISCTAVTVCSTVRIPMNFALVSLPLIHAQWKIINNYTSF